VCNFRYGVARTQRSAGRTVYLGFAPAWFTYLAGLILASPVVGLRRPPPREHATPHAGNVGASRLVMSIFGRPSGKIRPSTI
jgi:hypothetical protein